MSILKQLRFLMLPIGLLLLGYSWMSDGVQAEPLISQDMQNSTAGISEEQITIPLGAYINRTHFLSTTTTVLSGTLMVDDSENAYVIFGSVVKNLEISLESPDGTVHTLGDEDSATIAARISPDPNDPASTGANYYFILTNPQVGEWTYKIRPTEGLTTTRAVLLNFFSDSPVRAGLLGGGATYRIDRTINLAAVTVEGENVRNDVNVSATLRKANDQAFPEIPLGFVDDGTASDQTAGDGLYTATWLPTDVGDYYVDASVAGTAATGEPFERTLFAEFSVQAVNATLTSAFAETAVDNDFDGLVDEIIIAPEIEVVESGRYVVYVTLTGSNGRELVTNSTVDLSLGIASPSVSISTQSIREVLAVNGPYAISEVRLELEQNGLTVDAVYEIGTTDAYILDNFQRNVIELTTGVDGQSQGVDVDGDQLFDYLDVNLSVNSAIVDFYEWTARLVDKNGVEITLAESSGTLGAGENLLLLRFDGNTISANMIDGPYFVRNLIVFGNAGNSLSVNEVLTTSPFLASDFAGFQAPMNLELSEEPSSDKATYLPILSR